jgi:hypothetical protein
MKLTAAMCDDHAALKSGAVVTLLDPVRDTGVWTVADQFGYVIAVPRGKMRLHNRTEVVMRLESERSRVLLDLQETARARPEIAMMAARSYELNRLLAALPDAL